MAAEVDGEGGLKEPLLDSENHERSGHDEGASSSQFSTKESPFDWTWVKKVSSVVFGLVVFVVVYFAPMLDGDGEAEQHKCAALFGLVVVLWASEALPLFTTALLIPFLVVILRIMKLPARGEDSSAMIIPYHCARHPKYGQALDAQDAATVMSMQLFDPVILLFLGGFSIAAALTKYEINQRMASFLLKLAGTRPSRVLLTVMVLGTLTSAFVSNVAAAVLSVSIVDAFLYSLPKDAGYPKTMLLGIAYSCNIGGMTTPIASPQNSVAIKALEIASGMEIKISFLQWIAFSIPFCILCLFLVWGFLRLSFKTGVPEGITRGTKEYARMGLREVYIIAVVAFTILLWCLSNVDAVSNFFGNNGIIALIPILAFFGTGLLNTQDFDRMAWSILILMGGGLCLGAAIDSSGLLDTVAGKIGGLVSGLNFWIILLIFNVLVAVVSNFISSTVAAIIICPVIAKVGMQVQFFGSEDAAARVLVISSAVMCSGAMGLPVSSFPNANSYRVHTEEGSTFLKGLDYMRTGFPISAGMVVLLNSVGFGIFSLYAWLGFF